MGGGASTPLCTPDDCCWPDVCLHGCWMFSSSAVDSSHRLIIFNFLLWKHRWGLFSHMIYPDLWTFKSWSIWWTFWLLIRLWRIRINERKYFEIILTDSHCWVQCDKSEWINKKCQVYIPRQSQVNDQRLNYWYSGSAMLSWCGWCQTEETSLTSVCWHFYWHQHGSKRQDYGQCVLWGSKRAEQLS